MAEIVLVHGIGQEQKSPDTVESEYLPNLAGGVRLAGYPECADRIWRASPPGDDVARVAFYGDLFRRADQQGEESDLAELTAEQAALAEQLLTEWTQQFAGRATDPGDRQHAERALQHARGGLADPQGLRAGLRPVLRFLSRTRPLAGLGEMIAGRVLRTAIVQVSRYLTEDALRARVQQRVSERIGPETKVLIGHSLGSVVAFEAAHRIGAPIPTLITLGSPLGLRNIVYDRVRPQPPSVPPLVQRWINVADRDDLVAADLNLDRRFAGAQGVLRSTYLVDNGVQPHNAASYLTNVTVGGAIGAGIQ